MNQSKPVSFLFIHYHYPPIKNSGVYRNYFLSSAIADIGGVHHLITTDNRKLLPNEILGHHENIHRSEVWTLDYRSVIAGFSKSDNSKGAQFKESNKKSRFVKWLLRVQRSFPFNIFLAEGGLFYILNGYKVGKKIISENKTSIIYSSFMPYADHVIAYLLKSAFPKTTWVADFRDLQIEPIYNNTIWNPVQIWFERRLLSKADLITTVSGGISKKMLRYKRPVVTILKGVSERWKKPQFETFTISYSGSLFQHYRDPKVFLEALESLIQSGKMERENIQLLYAGKDGNQMLEWIEQYNLGSIFVDKGWVSRSDALNLQDRSHINLLLTSSSDEHQGLLTGKMFEYFESQNPVLCVIKGVYDSEIEGLFAELNAGKIVYDPSNDREIVENFILEKYHEWQNTGKVLPMIHYQKLLDKYGWKVQANKLLNAIESI